MRELLADFLDRALRYIDSLDSRGVAPSVEAVERLALLDEPLPERHGAGARAHGTATLPMEEKENWKDSDFDGLAR